MTENRLRRILQEGGTSIATRISSRWGLITEAAAASGCYDYVEYVLEYAPFQVEDLENCARTCELHGMGSIVKVDWQCRGWWAQKALAAGIQGILFTDCRTAEDAADCVRLTMPDSPGYGGTFGFSNYRWPGYDIPGKQLDYAKMVSDTVRLFMIEKKEAVDNIEQIVQVPGVDMIQFGPSDFSMSWGRNASDPDWIALRREAERHCIRVALEHGVQPRCEIQTPEEARYYQDLGVRHFCLGDEIKILRSHWAQQGAALERMVK